MQFLIQSKRALLIALVAVGASGLLPSTAWSQQASAEKPDELIKRITNNLLEAVQTDPALASGDVEAIRAYVQTNVLPHINFEGMVAAAVGQPWREATPEQRSQLQAAYQTLLLRSYAGALTKLVGQKLEVNPLRAASDDTEVVVNSRLIGQGSGSNPVRLDYRMQKGTDGWKIQDVGVGGVWLNQNYRSQFASIVRKQGLDGLISLLEKRAKG